MKISKMNFIAIALAWWMCATTTYVGLSRTGGVVYDEDPQSNTLKLTRTGLSADFYMSELIIDRIEEQIGWQNLTNFYKENKTLESISVDKTSPYFPLGGTPFPMPKDVFSERGFACSVARENFLSLYMASGIANLYVSPAANGVNWTIEACPERGGLREPLRGFIMYSFIALPLVLLGALQLLRELKGHKTTLSQVALILFLLTCPFAIFNYFLPIYPIPRTYNSSADMAIKVLKEHSDAIKDWIATQSQGLIEPPEYIRMLPQRGSASDTWIFPTMPQEKNIGKDRVFISAPPAFKDNYMRLNIDAYNYVFVSPELTQQALSAINEKMHYVDKGDGIWLGQYRTDMWYIQLFHWLNILWWVCLAGLWIGSISVFIISARNKERVQIKQG